MKGRYSIWRFPKRCHFRWLSAVARSSPHFARRAWVSCQGGWSCRSFPGDILPSGLNTSAEPEPCALSVAVFVPRAASLGSIFSAPSAEVGRRPRRRIRAQAQRTEKRWQQLEGGAFGQVQTRRSARGENDGRNLQWRRRTGGSGTSAPPLLVAAARAAGDDHRLALGQNIFDAFCRHFGVRWSTQGGEGQRHRLLPGIGCRITNGSAEQAGRVTDKGGASRQAAECRVECLRRNSPTQDTCGSGRGETIVMVSHPVMAAISRRDYKRERGAVGMFFNVPPRRATSAAR